MNGMKRLSVITEKGYALMAAIDAGLLEETEDGWNTEKFEKFWAQFTQSREKNPIKYSVKWLKLMLPMRR